MKFFKKRLNKRKLTKSLTETSLIAPPTTAHQHDNNKPLPPSPSLMSMPQQAPTASVEAANSDSWLELNLPNDFSSSLDIPPQLQTKATPLVQESENITETSLFSYPDNHIDTTTHDEEPNKPDEEEEEEESVVVSVAATPSSSARPDSVDRDNQQDESPLQQPVEKQGDTLLNDTCRDAIVLVNATLIPTDAMQHMELEEADDLSERESSAQEEQAAVELDVFLAATTVSTLTLVADTVIEPGDNAQETQPLHSSIPTDKDTLEIASPVEMSSTIDNENLDDLQIADASSPTPFPPPLLLATEEPSSQAASSTEESSLQDSQGDTFKIAKRKSAISLIPRSSKQQQSTDANVKKDGSRRASSSSFIPVLATRHQHAASVCLLPSKDAAALATTVPVTTWSPSSSSERNSVSSSDSASSCGSQQHQEKRTSLIAKSSATHQQQLLVLQSKIPKASFGMPLTANTEISKAVPTTTAQQQHVSRLPTKRNSTLA